MLPQVISIAASILPSLDHYQIGRYHSRQAGLRAIMICLPIKRFLFMELQIKSKYGKKKPKTHEHKSYVESSAELKNSFSIVRRSYVFNVFSSSDYSIFHQIKQHFFQNF
jgi:hypothetical protein